ncbi:MAG: hypothetical protein JNM25_13940 [Planctomycetes bacterium]|nr:hypothetical protein [Planctomycetota bacterium]
MIGRDLLLLICLASFAVMVGAILVAVARGQRRRASAFDQRRLDLLEQALRHPALDEGTRAELLKVLAARPGGRPDHRPEAATAGRGDWWHLLWFGPGWILFVLGGCMLGARALSLAPGADLETFLPMTITGFAMLTLPLALRELHVRRDRPAPANR